MAVPKRILISTNQLRHIRGSELVTLELVEHFLGQGAHVDVANNLHLPPMSDEFARLPGQERLVVATDPYHSFTGPYDLIWVQHSLIPQGVVEQLKTTASSTAVVWHHMSAHVHMELPVLADLEDFLADVSTAISPEVAKRLEEFGLPQRRIALFDNPAPDAFADAVRHRVSSSLQRLLVVSNHPPAEVTEAVGTLRDGGTQVDVLGETTGVARVTPALLDDYDAVLTIGKTVQYAMSMGIPCYVYDHFGGAGWLSEANLEAERWWNFSGRASRRQVDGATIAAELVAGYPTAAEFASAQRAVLAEQWRLSTQIDRLLTSRFLTTPRRKRLTTAQAERLLTFCELHRGMYRTLEHYRDELARVQAQLQDQLRPSDVPDLPTGHEEEDV